MNIHCSACGAPLLQGARFCPACALPLTAIAMPTPAPRRKRVSTLTIVVAAFAILWIVAYALDAHDSSRVSASSHQPTPAQNWENLEQKVEQSEWFNAHGLRTRRAAVAIELQAEHDPAAAADQQAALARIDARLQALRSAR